MSISQKTTITTPIFEIEVGVLPVKVLAGNIHLDVLILGSTDGTLLFKPLKKVIAKVEATGGAESDNDEVCLPDYFKFETKMRFKTAKVGSLRTYGEQ